MQQTNHNHPFIPYLILILLLVACKETKKVPEDTRDKAIAEKINEIVSSLKDSATNNVLGQQLKYPAAIDSAYEDYGMAMWSSKDSLIPVALKLFDYIRDCRNAGLFREDYHYNILDSINKGVIADSLKKGIRTNAATLAATDVLLTDAFFRLISDLKNGRLPKDSISLRRDSSISIPVLQRLLNSALEKQEVASVLATVEPKQPEYIALKKAIPSFLQNYDSARYTWVYTKEPDSLRHIKSLIKRFKEAGIIEVTIRQVDSTLLANAVKKYQVAHGLKADGKAGDNLVRILNNTDREKFIRIAINMDRYKLLPDTMPANYIWVNIPTYKLKLVDSGIVKLGSKVICGKSNTRTPLLNSTLTDIVTYPTWTVPTSIILKDILPAAKRNPGYFARRGFDLVTGSGKKIDPYSVNWAKYSKGIPYRVVQRSGNSNALGIIKFNFRNKYAVYLHDTNQRYLFGNNYAALSHGCVRVKEWDSLAHMILRKDSISYAQRATRIDSLEAWLKRKEKHSIPIFSTIPIFLRYFTVEGRDGKVIFNEDIYGEEAKARQLYFANK